jgi:Zn-finger nucleic acid-binding protein
MNCPIDGSTLQMSDRQGIEIDYCPQCRGVWLDRGELDKIIERSATWDGGGGDDRGRDGAPKAEPAAKPKKSKSKSFFETIMESVGEGGG